MPTAASSSLHWLLRAGKADSERTPPRQQSQRGKSPPRATPPTQPLTAHARAPPPRGAPLCSRAPPGLTAAPRGRLREASREQSGGPGNQASTPSLDGPASPGTETQPIAPRGLSAPRQTLEKPIPQAGIADLRQPHVMHALPKQSTKSLSKPSPRSPAPKALCSHNYIQTKRVLAVTMALEREQAWGTHPPTSSRLQRPCKDRCRSLTSM